jgi:hypothetical protein
MPGARRKDNMALPRPSFPAPQTKSVELPMEKKHP